MSGYGAAVSAYGVRVIDYARTPGHTDRRAGAVAEIHCRTLDGIPFFIDNEADAPVLIKER